LVASDHLGPLDETAERAGQRRRPLDRAMGDARAERDSPVDLDAGEPGNLLETDHVARPDPPALDLDDQVGAAGQKARLRAEARGEGDRVLQALGLVILESAHAMKSFALTCGGQIDARRSPASIRRGASACRRSSESR